jgi:hypothetical protein
MERLKAMIGKHPSDSISLPHRSSYSGRSRLVYVRYQWSWVGNQAETQVLTTDLKHSVKQHVVVKRTVPINAVELGSARRVRGQNNKTEAATESSQFSSTTPYNELVNFEFRIQV